MSFPSPPTLAEALCHTERILTLQQMKHIYQCQMFTLVSVGFGEGDTITLSSIVKDLAVVAAAAACLIGEAVSAQLYPSQSESSSRL